jgi:hypothetical protein
MEGASPIMLLPTSVAKYTSEEERSRRKVSDVSRSVGKGKETMNTHS